MQDIDRELIHHHRFIRFFWIGLALAFVFALLVFVAAVGGILMAAGWLQQEGGEPHREAIRELRAAEARDGAIERGVDHE